MLVSYVVTYPRIRTTWSSSWWTSRDVWIRTGDAKMNAEVQEIRIRDNDFILSTMIIWSNIILMSPTLWLTKQFVKDPVTTIKWCLKKYEWRVLLLFIIHLIPMKSNQTYWECWWESSENWEKMKNLADEWDAGEGPGWRQNLSQSCWTPQQHWILRM